MLKMTDEEIKFANEAFLNCFNSPDNRLVKAAAEAVQEYTKAKIEEGKAWKKFHEDFWAELLAD